ncbi:hypothetical protein NKH54_22565 [Mesorhizobium sp. M1004]|uniref:hypothetical protein n=1 Tax=Mesorhizobium sp. M1004 TaxID=2957046 RepID=UPI0033369876
MASTENLAPLSPDDLADLVELHAELMRPGEADDITVHSEYVAFAEELLAETDDGVASRTADTEPETVRVLADGLVAAAQYHRLRSERFLEAARRLQTARGLAVY